MSKRFNIREWVLSVKYWSLLFIPHISICLIFLIYMLIGTSIIQEIESEELENSSVIKNFQRERFLTKIIEKREVLDIDQYTKYVYKYILRYEEEIKKQIDIEENFSWNFSKALFFISTSLTTIGSNEFLPKTKLGKLFLIIYTSFGIPLTFVFLTDLSYLMRQLIQYITLIIVQFYSSHYILPIRRLRIFRFVDKYLNMSIDDEECNPSYNTEKELTLIQLILTLFIYILIGSSYHPSKTYFESFYLCYTTLFTINLNKKFHQEKHFIFHIIYLFFGLAIVLLCIQSIQIQIQTSLTNIGNKFLRNLVEFAQQIGFHGTDLFPDTNSSSSSTLSRSLELRPIGIAEPLRRLSTGFIRALKTTDNNNEEKVDKSVQVTTIIRRCGRCAETTLPILPVRKHSAISTSSSSFNDNSSCDDDDVMDFPPPNLDRIRQRRATLVAKTIINQMASQSRSSSVDELMPPLTFISQQRQRSGDSSPAPVRCSVKVSSSRSSPISESPRRRKDSLEEFTEISRQISSLLTPSDDEN